MAKMDIGQIGKEVELRLADQLKASDRLAKEEARKQALQATQKLLRSLQSPEETILQYALEAGSQRMAIRCAVDLGIFGILSRLGGGSVTSKELAEECRAEQLLVTRIMRALVAIDFAAQVDIEAYAATRISLAMATPAMEGGVIMSNDFAGRIFINIHEYFREKGYKSPTNGKDCAMQWAFNGPDDFFTHLHKNPKKTTAFNNYMTRIRSTRRHWTEWFPVETEVLEGSKGEEGCLLIDMGGGKGHDIETFAARFPNAKGQLILQDIPGVINNIAELKSGIEPMTHDFFTPQPVHGARVYFTHFIFHDWSDEVCRDILRNLMPAMTPGYSKILLNEVVLPDMNCGPFFAALDLNMLANLAAMERTKSHWIELVESVGLKVTSVRVSPFPGDAEGIIEAMLPLESSTAQENPVGVGLESHT